MLVMSEITPVKARGAASAITVVVAWVSSFIITKVKTVPHQFTRIIIIKQVVIGTTGVCD